MATRPQTHKSKKSSTLKAEDIEEAIQKAANEAAERVIEETESEDDQLEQELEEQVHMSAEELDAVDIFSTGEEYFAKGLNVGYEIKKNRETVAYKAHPCSWNEVHKSFGAGHFQIILWNESGAKRKYIKSQSKRFGDTTSAFGRPAKAVHEDESPTPAREDAGAGMATVMSDFARLFSESQAKQQAMFTEMFRAQQTAPKTPTLVEQLGALAPVLAPIVSQLMAPKEDKTTPMILELVKESKRETEKILENMRRDSEKQIERFHTQLEKLTVELTKKKEQDPMELVKMIKEAENDGWEKAQLVMDQAEKVAEREIERAEAAREAGGDAEKSGGFMDKIVDVLPALLAAKGPGMALPEVPSPHASFTRAAGEPKLATLNPEVVKEAPAAAPAQAAPQATVTPIRPPVEKTFKEKVIDFTMPLILQAMASEKQPDHAAAEIIAALEDKKAKIPKVVKAISKSEMLEIGRAYGLPPVAITWLEHFYDNVKAYADSQVQSDTAAPVSDGGAGETPSANA